tara:strand:- start:671 stop:889 length:219 start_codon:yes stop_codon:yes gene_type:complete
MVSKQLEDLSEDDLQYIEKLLGESLSKELEADKTWKSKNGYSRPFAQQRRILNCMNAIRAQREYKRKMSIKW